MGRSQETFSKKEKEKKRLQKRQEKQLKREERKENSAGGGLENMLAYVDEFGNITDTPPDPTRKKSVIDASSIEIAIPKQAEEDLSLPKKGKIDFFNESKGYGFIREDGTQEKYFVHVNGLTEEVREGDKVTFELEKGLKGLNAVNVKRV
ncbi:cold-shock protein [Pelobium manganitolerans]|uniref:cold-shock protein n=1 Tax=Pelobium manganitolerans TaxID=1842495 RepID=UPI003FA3C5DC